MKDSKLAGFISGLVNDPAQYLPSFARQKAAPVSTSVVFGKEPGEVYEDPAADTTMYQPVSKYSFETVKRLGLPEESESKLIQFADTVAEIESNRNPKAKNKTTTATGAFQFVRGSVVPALNRMARFGDLPDWGVSLLEKYKKGVTPEEHRELISSLPYEKQRDMFLADISEKKVEKSGLGDTLIKGIALGSIDAMRDLYLKGHHTAPDEPTLKRVYKYFN